MPLPAHFLTARLGGPLPLARFAALLSPCRSSQGQVKLGSNWQSFRKDGLPCQVPTTTETCDRAETKNKHTISLG